MLESWDSNAMNSDLNTVFEAAMKLPPTELRELMYRLSGTNLSNPKAYKKKPGILRKYFGMVESGDPTLSDNELIDAELAVVYSDDHVADE